MSGYGNASYGATAYGGGRAAVTRPSYRLQIGGVDFTGAARWESLKCENALAQRSTLEVDLVDDSSASTWPPGCTRFDFREGARVYLWAAGELEFGGTVEEVQTDVPDFSDGRFVKLTAVDWTELCDRYFVTAIYDDATLEEIVRDIVYVQTPLWQDGVQVGGVKGGITFSAGLDPDTGKKTGHGVVFNYQPVTDCFRELAEASGTSWNIFPSLVLEFFDTAAYAAPFAVGDSNQHFYGMALSGTRSRYRNQAWLRAGKGRTAERTETFRGDSTATTPEKRRRTFTLAYPLADKPEISLNGSAIPANRIGVKGKDPDGDLTKPSASTWPKWFYQLGEKEISQNSKEDEVNNPTLEADDKLEVTYFGEYPIVIESRNQSEIDAAAASEGGAGIYQAVDDDDKVDGETAATEKAARLMAMFGRRPRTLQWSSDTPGLKPGHLMPVTRRSLGVDNVQYLVDTVEITFLANGSPRFTVTALDGQRQDGWSDWFRRQYLAGRKFTIRENEKVLISRSWSETVRMTDGLAWESGDQTDPYTDDPFSWIVLGSVVAGGTTKYGWDAGRSRVGRPYGS